MPGGSTWSPTTTDDWIRTIDKRVTQLERRSKGSDLSVSGAIVSGQLEGIYRGPGPARVLINGTLVGPFEWLQPYVPSRSREVDLIRVDGQWRILSQSGVSDRGGWMRLETLNGWEPYGDGVPGTTNPTAQWQEPAMATRLTSGIVVLSGLLGGGALTAGTVIAVLPPSMRPDYEIIFPVEVSDLRRGLGVKTNGNIEVRGTWTGTYASLDGLAFPAAGVANWTLIDPAGTAGSANAFINGWNNHVAGGGQWGPARYWADPYGTIWYGGVVSGGTLTDNTGIFTMPAALRTFKEEHIPANGGDGYAAVGMQPTTGLNIKTNSSASYTSLGGVNTQTVDSYNDPAWRAHVLTNSWVRYDSPAYKFPEPATRRRPDGLVQSRGMISTGTLGQRAMQVPLEQRPAKQTILAAISSSARARTDVTGGQRDVANNPGALVPVQGTTTWFSLDGLKWYPGPGGL